MPNLPCFKQRFVKSLSSFFVSFSLKPWDLLKTSFEQKIMPVVQRVQRSLFFTSIASLYFNLLLSGRTLQVPIDESLRVFLISSKIFCEWNLVSASRKINILPCELFAPRLRAFDTFLSFIARTFAYFPAINAVESVQPLHTTILSTSFGSDNSEDSMYFSS